MENVVDLGGIVLKQPTFETAVLAKLYLTIAALLRRWLHGAALQAFHLRYLVKLHTLSLAPLRLMPLVQFVVAQFAGIEYQAARSLHQTVAFVVLAGVLR